MSGTKLTHYPTFVVEDCFMNPTLPWLGIHFHGPPVCTIHRSVSGRAMVANGIQK